MSTTYIPVKAEEWAKMVEAMKLAADLLVENKRLKDENERLRKAGDAMAANLDRFLNEHIADCDWLRDGMQAWLAAKEGGSK